jgi:hypothetical protein
MRMNFKVRAILVAALAVVGSMFLAMPPDASARPKFKGEFEKKYDGKLAKDVVNCLICHAPKEDDATKHDVKKRNNYGEAVGKILGSKNEKDEAKIQEALTKAEKEKSAVEGKTFGDLIAAGKVPASKE